MLDEVAAGKSVKSVRNGWSWIGRIAPPPEPAAPAKDSFEEVDFGSYFKDYLDPGFRTQPEYEESEKPSFEHFSPNLRAFPITWRGSWEH